MLKPIYNFARHLRDSKSKMVVPSQILIVDGILVLNDDQLRKMMNLKVFVDVPPDLRFIRRLERDLSERGRSVESVTWQYFGLSVSYFMKNSLNPPGNTPISSSQVADTI